MMPVEIILGILGFIIAGFFAFYVPGRVVLGKIQFPLFAQVGSAIAVGVVLWVFQGIVGGYLGIRWISYVYLLVFFFIFIKNKYFTLPSISYIDIPAVAIAIVGVIGQTFPYLRMGWLTSQGVVVASHNSEDHIWHAALVKELAKRFPPNEPAISGVLLKDYHYFYNLVAADLVRVFHLPFFTTQFMGLYILAPILLGIIAYALAQTIFPSKTFSRIFLFLLYFSGNAAGWVMLIFRHTFTWNLSSLINDASKFMDSPPYGYAVVVGLTGLYLLLQYRKKLPIRMLLICALLFGSLLEFKVYVGIPFLVAFGGYAAGLLLKKQITPFLSFLLAGSLAFILLKSGSSSSAGLIFLPVDIPRDFINQPLLDLKDWQLRWVIYQDHHSIFRLIQYGAMMSGLYLLIQFGFQLLGLFPLRQSLKKLGLSLSLFLYAGVVSAFFLGLFFYQTVGGANIWEFFLAAVPLLDLMVSLSLALFLYKRPFFIRILVVVIVIIIVIPQWILSMQAYIHDEYFSGFHGVSTRLSQSFQYLNNETPLSSTIFVANQYGYSYASIMNLFVDRDLYLSGSGVRQIMTPEIAKRRQEVITISTSGNSQEIADVIHKENIQYVYFYGSPHNEVALKNANLHIVFANGAATIFQSQ